MSGWMNVCLSLRVELKSFLCHAKKTVRSSSSPGAMSPPSPCLSSPLLARCFISDLSSVSTIQYREGPKRHLTAIERVYGSLSHELDHSLFPGCLFCMKTDCQHPSLIFSLTRSHDLGEMLRKLDLIDIHRCWCLWYLSDREQSSLQCLSAFSQSRSHDLGEMLEKDE